MQGKTIDSFIFLADFNEKQPISGKVKAPVEFGAKLDVSIDSEGYGRLEKVSFDAYNESGSLIEAVERYKLRTGSYPERVLADQIYRTRGIQSKSGLISRHYLSISSIHLISIHLQNLLFEFSRQ